MAKSVQRFVRVLSVGVLATAGVVCFWGAVSVTRLQADADPLSKFTGLAGGLLCSVLLLSVAAVLRNNGGQRVLVLLMLAMVPIGWLNAGTLACGSVEVYQRCISPYKGWHCAHGHYYGGLSCSEFGKRAIAQHGLLAGWKLLQHRFDECGQAADLLHNGSLPSADCGDGAGTACYKGCNKGAGGR